MKKTFTLIIACFIVVSLLGQTANLSIQGHKKQRIAEAFQHKNERRLGLEKHQPANHRIESQVNLKSAEIVKQRLDSIVYKELSSSGSLINSSKEFYTYDSKGLLTSDFYYNWDESTGKWVVSEKGEYTRDSNGNSVLNISYDWDETTAKWVGSYKYESTYDANGNETIHISYSWDMLASKWIGSYKYESTYDAKGNNTLEMNYNWDVMTNKWVGSYKTENTYDSQGKRTFGTSYYWDTTTSSWVLSGKNEYTYDSNKNITTSIYSYNANGNWVVSSKYETTIDQNGNETYYASYNFNVATSKWDGSYKYESTYDANGFETLGIDYEWDIYTEKWVVDSRSESTIDSNGNLSLMVYYERDETTGVLELSEKTEVSWNNSFSDFILPEDWSELELFRHMITGYNASTWDSGSNQWTIDEKAVFYYSGQNVSGIQEDLISLLSVYPNPASDLVTFDLDNTSQSALVELFDIQGKKVISQVLPRNKQISVSQLKSGMYFYSIDQKSTLYRGKIMIK